MSGSDDTPAMSRAELDRLFARNPTPAAPAPRPTRRSDPNLVAQVGRGQHAPVTSDLSIDETLLLHSIGWEPVDLVMGVSVAAIPPATFTLGFSDTDHASAIFTAAVQGAASRLRADSERAGGAGVVGVKVDFELHRTTVRAVLVGTAVRPSAGSDGSPRFISDLSTRDFCLLHNAGWVPLGLAFGTSFVNVPYRSVSAVFKQMTANVEMTNLTQALYSARDRSMERLQSSALAMGASGVVAVQVIDRPLPFASHVTGFTAWGTAVRLAGDSHNYLKPGVTVSMNDPVDMFDLTGALGEA